MSRIATGLRQKTMASFFVVLSLLQVACVNISYRSLAEEGGSQPKSGVDTADVQRYLNELPFAYLMVQRPKRLGAAFVLVEATGSTERWMDSTGALLYRDGLFSISSQGITGLAVATLDANLPDTDVIRNLIAGRVAEASGISLVSVDDKLYEHQVRYIYRGLERILVNDQWVETHQIEELVEDGRGNRWINVHSLLKGNLYNIRMQVKYSAEATQTVVKLFKIPNV